MNTRKMWAMGHETATARVIVLDGDMASVQQGYGQQRLSSTSEQVTPLLGYDSVSISGQISHSAKAASKS